MVINTLNSYGNFFISLVRYAAEQATDEQIAALEDALKHNSKSLNSPELFSNTDTRFHRVLAEIPGNPIFMAVHQAMVDWLINARREVDKPTDQLPTPC